MKKVLALVLVAVLSVGMMVTSFASADKQKYNDKGPLGISGKAIENAGSNSTLDNLDAGPDTKLYLNVTNLFDIAGNTTRISESTLRSDKITVKKSISKGSAVIRDIEFFTDSNIVYVRVRFVEEYVSTKDLDFDFRVYLANNGSKISNSEVTISGTFANPDGTVSEDDDYIYTGDKTVIEALDYVRGIEVDGGNGVSLITNMFDGKKYYFTVDMDVDSADDAIMAKYPEIEAVYNLNQVGFSTSGKIVKMDIDDKLYVYNAEGDYLGTTADMLTFSKKLYVSAKRIEMDISDGDGDGDGDTSEAPAESSTTNNNNNPDTGVNGFANIAVVAGVVALAAAGAVAFKK